MTMSSRERVTKAIHFQKPDRPPISHAILPSAQYHYGEELKEITDSVPEDFGWQLLPDLPREKLPPLYKEGRNQDAFGTVWMVTEEGRCGIPVEFPIAEDWSNLDDYKWPEVFKAGPPEYRLYSGHMTGTSDDYYARGGWIVFFEQIQQLHGFETVLMDLVEDKKELYQLRDRLLEFNMAWIDNWLSCEYQGLHFADDWGTQSNLFISPAKWRSFFKPMYKEMFSKVKNAGLDVWFHSDGMIIDIIPDLIELGVNVINCQISTMERSRIKEFAGQIAFRTDIDRQNLLPYATPQEIKDYIITLFHDVGTADGGIVACGEISEDVPLANIKAMYDAFLEFQW